MKSKLLTSLLILTVAPSIYADSLEITKPIIKLFDAMREHNGEKLTAQFTDTALLQRVTKDNTVKSSELNKFAQSISNTDKYLDEHLLNIDVKHSDNLAMVWTPYAFYLDKKLSHCGVNSFQLIKQSGTWKIQYLIDNVHQGDCINFIELHKK